MLIFVGEFGVGVVTVRRSNHYGAAGVYSTMAADRGMIGMCMTGSSQPAVLPTFAKEPRFSTNPIAVAAPGLKNEHFSLDMATSTVAVGKLNIARRAGKEIPLGWASDETGTPTTDPVAALNAVPKRLSPIGGSRELGSHKGYGLGLVVEILCSVLSGSYTGATDMMTKEQGETLNIGHFCLAIDPNAFREEGEFEAHMDALMDWMRDTPPLDPAQPVLVPGDGSQYVTLTHAADNAAMVAAAFDAEVSLIFRGDGIWSLLPEQNAQQVGQRSFAKVLQALGDYEVDQLYVCLDSLASRGVEAADLMQAEGLDLAAQQQLLAEQDAVIGAAL